MICPECHFDRPLDDFLNKEICFKCLFRLKTVVKIKKGTPCRICNKIIPKGRSVYCGYVCAEKADKAHWTRVIK